MKVFVIVITYKGKQWYDRCFGSLRLSSIHVQTIVVDNASNDGSVEYISANYPEIHLIESKENLGFGKANNIAMRYALNHDCDYVFLLNQDAWVESHSIEDLIRIHENHPLYGVLSPMHMRPDRKSLDIEIEDGQSDHGNKLLSDCYFNQLEDVYPFVFVNAAAWLIPRKTLETVGGFDPIFAHYHEDIDYTNRLHYHGMQLGLCPRVRIVHDHHSTPNPLSGGRIFYYQGIIANLIDPNKEDSVSKFLLYMIRKILACCLRWDFIMCQTWIRDFKFIHNKKGEIKRSRAINVLKQPSWL